MQCYLLLSVSTPSCKSSYLAGAIQIKYSDMSAYSFYMYKNIEKIKW